MAEDDLEDEYEDDAEDEGAEERGKGGGNKKKLLLLILLPLLLVIGGVAGAYFAGLMDPVLAMFSGADSTTPPAEGDAPTEGGGDGTPGPNGAIFYDLDQIVVDLNSSGRKRSYLQMRLSLQLESQQDVLRVEEAMPRIMDNFISFLRELRLEDLQGTAGMYRIQEELLIRVNTAAAPARVKDVLFKEMMIQ
ncbi:flagellar basal body-associated FliL family protein [Rhodospirillum sp. A1_3_36]|uniref:flagellar basal body-associated FliL family protein n=1 Tax=Rhodospirillum sp. A1_3_36 TaxID=3391666 RepID=UPI0039A58C95